MSRGNSSLLFLFQISHFEHLFQARLEQLEVVLQQSARLLQVLSVHQTHQCQAQVHFLQEQHHFAVQVESGGETRVPILPAAVVYVGQVQDRVDLVGDQPVHAGVQRRAVRGDVDLAVQVEEVGLLDLALLVQVVEHGLQDVQLRDQLLHH